MFNSFLEIFFIGKSRSVGHTISQMVSQLVSWLVDRFMLHGSFSWDAVFQPTDRGTTKTMTMTTTTTTTTTTTRMTNTGLKSGLGVIFGRSLNPFGE